MKPYASDSSFARSASTRSRRDRCLYRWGKRNGSRRRCVFHDQTGAARQAARRALARAAACVSEEAEGPLLVTEAEDWQDWQLAAW